MWQLAEHAIHPVEPDDLKRVVEDRSVAAGLQVKVSARSLADAALGDVITLQALDSTKRYQARVTGPQECMVFVDAPKVVAIDRK